MRIYFYAIILLLGGLESGQGQVLPPAPGDGCFPLIEGTTWRYASNLGDAVSTVTRIPEGYLLRSEAPHLVIEQVLAPSEWGLMLLRGGSRVYFIETARVYDPPMPRFPHPIEVGMRWEWEGREIVDEDEIITSKISGYAEAREKIEVPAGTFECIKVVITTASSDGTESSSVQWLAPGVGPVRLRVEIDAGGLTGAMVWLLGFDLLEFDLVSMERPDQSGPFPSVTPAPSPPPPNPLTSTGRRMTPRGMSH